MKIVLAPDSFKDSMSALEVCQAMQQGVAAVIPDAQFIVIPMADGGEGTTEALVAATGGQMRTVRATGPLPSDRPTADGRIGLSGDGRTAIIEMACVSGLPLVPRAKRNPLHTTTFGTGELIRAALDAGARHIIVGIGGSATTDLGTGMAQALGARFFQTDGSEITEPMTGGLLSLVASVDISAMHHAIADSRIEAACDVDNPLLGPRGCAAVYGPQKGATPPIVDQLESNLTSAIGIIEQVIGRPVRDVPGAGAAGGLGAGLMAFLGAELRPGIKIVLDASGFADRIRGAQLVLTGEGQIDRQTAYGKTISGVARTAAEQGIPVVALVGCVGEGVENLYDIGVTSMFSLVPGPCTLDDAMAGGKTMLASLTERVIRLFLAGRSRH